MGRRDKSEHKESLQESEAHTPSVEYKGRDKSGQKSKRARGTHYLTNTKWRSGDQEKQDSKGDSPTIEPWKGQVRIQQEVREQRLLTSCQVQERLFKTPRGSKRTRATYYLSNEDRG
jgi:hypothetical protein